MHFNNFSYAFYDSVLHAVSTKNNHLSHKKKAQAVTIIMCA